VIQPQYLLLVDSTGSSRQWRWQEGLWEG